MIHNNKNYQKSDERGAKGSLCIFLPTPFILNLYLSALLHICTNSIKGSFFFFF